MSPNSVSYTAMPSTNDAASPARPIKVFCAYSHRDEALRNELEAHVSLLKRRGVISVWHDRRIAAGKEWNEEISDHLNKADLILLLVSSDFIHSDYCYEKEVTRAMSRSQLGEAVVIPIILRDCDWDLAPFSKLQALPKDGKPVKAWNNQDEAFKDIAVGIRRVAEDLGSSSSKPWRENLIESTSVLSPSAPGRRHVSPVRNPRDLLLYGPRMKITFGPPILPSSLTSPSVGYDPSSGARFLQTDALVDLGAARTILTPNAVQKAGLVKIDQTNLATVGGTLKADIYAASLQFPSGLSAIETIAIVCCELQYPLFHCLLGRDVLSRWILNYNGPAGTWEIREKDGAPWEPREGIDPSAWRG